MAERTEMQSRTPDTQQERGLRRSTTDQDRLRRRDPFELFAGGPFALMRRMHEDMDRLFDSFASTGRHGLSQYERIDWMPDIDAFQRGSEFIVRADVPGLAREDLSVEVGDEAITIQGMRQSSRDEERDGVFTSERMSGRFSRVIPLPPGAVPESAKASFKNGVLEVVVQSPSQEVRRGRKVEIQEGQSTGGQQR
jgi:HSP20 family protein